MADNVGYTEGSGLKVASREITYSGETAQAQVVGLAVFSGEDDSKTAIDISNENPMPVDFTQRSLFANFLSRILNILTAPLGYRKDLQRYQATTIIESGTVTTVSTVTTCGTVTNIAQLGGLAAERLLLNQNLSSWAAIHRSRIS